MIYAERIDPKTFDIVDRGIFWTIEEFVDYRKEGWSASEFYNELADGMIEEEKEEVTA